MSGHSKWHNIRLRKGKADAQRGALFTKISKEIILAAKSGSPDPETNYRLKMAVEKARENNMPTDNIKRAIARGGGQGGEREIEEIRYEGYGPHGIAVVVDVATDNRNRTAGELRFMFSKHSGTLGETGSVGWMFDSVGILEIDTHAINEERLMEAALVDGVLDLEYDAPTALLYTEPTKLAAVREALVGRKLRVTAMYLGMLTKTKILPNDAQLEEVFEFLTILEDHEDVQYVFSNLDLAAAGVESPA